MARLLLKTDCDTCGCAWSWAGASDDWGGETDWETIDSAIVSAASPDWDFGARGAGVWKVTAYPSTVGGLNQLGGSGGTYYDDLNWTSGGVTLDNAGGRDRSYYLQFDSSVVLGAIQSNGHYSPTNAAPRSAFSFSNWGTGFDQTGANANNAGGATQFAGAVFVWMTGVNHYALPATITGDSSDSATTALKDIFRRQILAHTDGGTIAGSISSVTTSQRTTGFDLSGQTWEVRLHKMAPPSDTVWLENLYPKPVKALRLKRWAGHLGADGALSIHCAWVFPLWHYDLTLDRLAPANMGDCDLHHFKVDIDAPLTWTPEQEYRSASASPNKGEPLTFGATNWGVGGAGLAGSVGVVREGNWSAWTVTPIFDDDTLGDETILGSVDVHRRRGYFDHAQPLGLFSSKLGQFFTDGSGNARGCGFRAPSYRGGVGAFPGTREHTSSLGGVPVCVDFGTLGPNLTTHIQPDSGYLDTDGEAVSF